MTEIMRPANFPNMADSTPDTQNHGVPNAAIPTDPGDQSGGHNMPIEQGDQVVGGGGKPTVEGDTNRLPFMLANLQFTISTQRTKDDLYLKPATITLQGFVDELSRPEVKSETQAQFLSMKKDDQVRSKDVGGYVLGTFRNNRRVKRNVIELCGVALDADHAQPGMIDTIRYSVPYLTIVHSTRKHSRDKPRYRIIFLLSHPVTPEQHSAISRKLADQIGMEMFDKSSFEPNRMMFFPSISSDSEYVFKVFGRELCDPDAVLAEYDDWRDISQWPVCPDEKGFVNGDGASKKLVDPLSKGGVIGAYIKTHSISRILEEFGTDLYEPSSIPNRWSYKEADSTAGAVSYDNDTTFYSFHASDPLSGIVMNAFDLARVLHFGHLDEKCRNNTPTDKLPSYKAMMAYARDDGDVREMLAWEKAEEARKVFGYPGSSAPSGAISSMRASTGSNGFDPSKASDPSTISTGSDPSTGSDYATSEDGSTPSGLGELAECGSGEGEQGEQGEQGEGEPGVGGTKDPDWKRKLQYNSYGDLENSMYNAMQIFHNDENLQAIIFNELSESLEIKVDRSAGIKDVPWSHPNEIWRDQDDSQLIAYLELNYGSFSERIYRNAVAKIADDRRYHPIRDYMNALPPWDGIPRVDRLLCTTLGAEDSPYVHAVTRKTLCAAIARIMVPGTKFDTILVMIGPQGTGKSTLISRLGMKWFNDSLMLTDTKDRTAPEKLQGYWIHEISELAGLRKGDQETMKGFLSRQNDIFRPAYGRRSTPHMRQCIFVGTTNAEQGFLRDTTGNRRFWPVTVPGYSARLPETVPPDAATFHKQSWKLTQDDIDQIWAETLTYYNAHEPLVLPAELKEEAEAIQRESMETDDRESLVREYLEKLLPENWYDLEIPVRLNYLNAGEFAGSKLVGTMKRDKVCNMEVWTECFGNTSSKIGRSDSNQIIAMLERIPGWKRSPVKKRIKPYGVVTAYVRDNTDSVESAGSAETSDSAGSAD